MQSARSMSRQSAYLPENSAFFNLQSRLVMLNGVRKYLSMISKMVKNNVEVAMLNLNQLILGFRNYAESEHIDLYNEFSFQHELGIFLRNKLNGYKVQFERNVSYFGISKNTTIKKEIDIVVFNEDKSEKYAFELKFPRNGEYPEQMYAFAKDVLFAEQLKENGFIHTCVVTLIDDLHFCFGSKIDGIYQYFRGSIPLSGVIYKPTGNGKGIENINFHGVYHINWNDFDARRKYYIITI